jgi:hypothetical protein
MYSEAILNVTRHTATVPPSRTRLRRRDVRKGCAFPSGFPSIPPRLRLHSGGVASRKVYWLNGKAEPYRTVRRRSRNSTLRARSPRRICIQKESPRGPLSALLCSPLVSPSIIGNTAQSQSQSIFRLERRRHSRSFGRHHYRLPRK